MTCPHCGAYSPKNTSVCNRCGRKLPLLEAGRERTEEEEQRIIERYGYGYGYRQPEQTEFQKFLEKAGTFLDDIVEDPFAKRVAIAIITVPVTLYIILRLCGVCGGCFRCGPACLPEEPVVSAADVSYSDVVSGSSVSPSDGTETTGTSTAASEETQ